MDFSIFDSKAMKLKISDIKEIRTARRPTLEVDEYGNRIYEELDFEVDFINTIPIWGSERFLAKIIDLLPFFAIGFFLFKFGFGYSFLLAILLVMLSGSYLEYQLGTTLGKSLMGFIVVDEYAQTPTFKQTLIRNFLGPVNFWPSFLDISGLGPVHTQLFFNMQLNNRISKTYVLNKEWKEKVEQVLKKEAQKSPK